MAWAELFRAAGDLIPRPRDYERFRGGLGFSVGESWRVPARSLPVDEARTRIQVYMKIEFGLPERQGYFSV